MVKIARGALGQEARGHDEEDKRCQNSEDARPQVGNIRRHKKTPVLFVHSSRVVHLSALSGLLA